MSRTQRFVYSSIFIALSVVLTRVFSYPIVIAGIGAIRLGFGPLPIILGGILLGPVYGGIIGALADILGYLLNPMGGGYVPIIAVVSAARGILPPIILSVIAKRRYTFWSLLVAIGVTQLFLSIWVMPLILYRWFGVPIWSNVPVRLVTQLILIPIYTSMSSVLLDRLPKAIPSLGKQ
jgi:ECF transporter S component (folate family)